MSRFLKIVLALNLAALAVLTFVYPHLMVSPGKLIPGHRQLDTDCFACHAPLTGADSARCIACHKPADIGKLTTAGQPVVKPLTKTPFHQQLAQEDCVACHSDHAGVKRYRSQGRFNHALLKSETRQQCRDCHTSPADKMHRELAGGPTEQCSNCHGQEKWKPATFDHARLAPAALAQCQTCHRPPTDQLHRDLTENCGQCHSQKRWTPATFDHDKYFALDRDHNVQCATCHPRNDFKQYTCYGCHEHSQEKIRRKHIKEGIRDFSQCTECHKNADEHDIRGPGREGRREDRKHDDD